MEMMACVHGAEWFGGLCSSSVLETLTNDQGAIMRAMAQLKIGGAIQFVNGVAVAALALKHRPNKAQRQRVIVFVGSPIADDSKEMVKLAKRLKKNNVNVDVINFADEEANVDKLDAFITAVNGKEGQRCAAHPPAVHDGGLTRRAVQPLDHSSGWPARPVRLVARFAHSERRRLCAVIGWRCGADGHDNACVRVCNSCAVTGARGGAGHEYGIDPNTDPELAMALRISLEEERARQEAGARATADAAGGASSGGQLTSAESRLASAVAGMDLGQDQPAHVRVAASVSAAETDPLGDAQESTEDDELQLALKLSLQVRCSGKEEGGRLWQCSMLTRVHRQAAGEDAGGGSAGAEAADAAAAALEDPDIAQAILDAVSKDAPRGASGDGKMDDSSDTVD
jgi:26S proteasome regulatory subunit N10